MLEVGYAGYASTQGHGKFLRFSGQTNAGQLHDLDHRSCFVTAFPIPLLGQSKVYIADNCFKLRLFTNRIVIRP